MSGTSHEERAPLSSMDRALLVVEFLARRGPEGAPLSDIAAAVESNKATVHHTLRSLRYRNWVDQDPDNGYYFLGDGVDPIIRYTTRTQFVVDQLHPALVAICHRYNELVHLGKLSGQVVTYLDKVEPDRPIRVVSFIGRNAPAVTTALGRALLGANNVTGAEIDWYLSVPTDNPPTRATIEECIEHVHRYGWGMEVEENEAGIACVAVPVDLKNGERVAVSVTAPAERLGAATREAVAYGIAEEITAIAGSTGVSVPEVLLPRSAR